MNVEHSKREDKDTKGTCKLIKRKPTYNHMAKKKEKEKLTTLNKTQHRKQKTDQNKPTNNKF